MSTTPDPSLPAIVARLRSGFQQNPQLTACTAYKHKAGNWVVLDRDGVSVCDTGPYDPTKGDPGPDGTVPIADPYATLIADVLNAMPALLDAADALGEAKVLLARAYDRLACTDPTDEYPDGESHYCGKCYNSVDRNWTVREAIRRFLRPEDPR